MSSVTVRPERLAVSRTLAGQRVLLTGATGFLGKVLAEKLLWAVPDLEKLILLIRAEDDETALDRARREVFHSPIMARLHAHHGHEWPGWIEDKVEARAGDLSQDRLGLDEEMYDHLAGSIDRIIGCAATVKFDERLDRAFAVNTRGAEHTLQLARDAGDVPLLHVSTCFVSGERQGKVSETPVDAEALEAESAMSSLESACEALRESGEQGDSAWIAAGAEQARRFAFHDVYTLTKALAERRLVGNRGDVPLAIVRPAIVESAAVEPVAGWIEAVRVTDPLLVAYGRGRTDEIPGSPHATLDLIPVDHVANATIAALAELQPGAERATEPGHQSPVPVYQVGSQRNPISLEQLLRLAREGFRRAPLRTADGSPISPGPVRFTDPDEYHESLLAQRRKVRALLRWIPRRRSSPDRLKLRSTERALDHLIHLLEVYRPYLGHGAIYDDSATRQLWQSLSPDDQETFPFDITTVDWSAYIAKVHVPGLVRFALRAETGAPVPVADDEREPATEILSRSAAHAASSETLYEFFASTAGAYSDAMALQTFRDGRWLRYTYRQALTAVTNIAARLREEFGLGHGDRLILLSTGCPEWVLTTFAAHRLGATTVPLDPQWPAEEVVQAAQLVDARLICAAPNLIGTLAEVNNGDLPLVELRAPFVPEPDVGLLPGTEASIASADPPTASTDLASIIFTSGTTVAPKAVPLTHANYLANVRALVPLMKLTRERLLSVLPIHHVFEQMVGLLVPMTGGSTVSYVAEVKPAEISWMMQTTRPTVLVAVPRLLELLHNGIRQNVAAGGPMLKLLFRILFALSRRRDGENGHKLFAKVHQRFGGSLRRIASGGSALEPSLGRSFLLMGFKVAEGYGMTETSPVLTVNPWDAIRFGSVGQPLTNVEIDLRPPSEVAEGLEPGSGEVWVRGPNVMTGYYQNPEATAAVMDDGWLNTGDIGYVDDDGYLHLSGRSKDVIVTSAGKNVYPEEVEARYRDLPGVAELVVLGLPTDGGGERVSAVVVPADRATEADIREAIAGRSRDVPSYQQIAGIEIWDGDLPKTTTMKVKRAVLLDAVLAGERGSGAKASTPDPTPDVEQTEAELAVLETVARVTRSRSDLLQADDRLVDLGVDSLTRVELVGELEARFGLRLDDETAARLDTLGDLYSLVR
ncbi:MAG: AMP-binding protein [Thermoanaerobaculia bacterium]|nr:AMP-binding protein [Thermoanaerobaculia bacterium]